MVSGRGALGLTGVVTLLLLVPPEVLSHDSAPQNSPSSRQSDPGRPQRQGREQKAREITRDATVLLKRAAASRLDSAEAMQLLIDAATRNRIHEGSHRGVRRQRCRLLRPRRRRSAGCVCRQFRIAERCSEIWEGGNSRTCRSDRVLTSKRRATACASATTTMMAGSMST
jgi:hypothetical protein